MTDQEPKKLRKPAVRQRPNSAEEPRPVMSFRIRADLQRMLRDTAEADGLAFSEEIERRLIRSFETEEQIANLHSEVAAQREHIANLKTTSRMLWPDTEARVLGEAFAMALAGVRHASGPEWREDPAAGLILAGAVRRMVDRVTRSAPLAAPLLHAGRIAATAEAVADTLATFLDEHMPPMRARAFDPMQWTGRARLVTEFRDATSGDVLETITGPEWDAGDPEQRPAQGDGYKAALAHFAPIREKVDAETFTVYVLQDGNEARERLSFTPAGPGPQPAKPPQASEPTADPDDAPRLIGMEATGRLAPGMKPPRGMLPPSIDDKSEFDRAMGPERPDDDTPPEPQAPMRRDGNDVEKAVQAAKPRRKAKAPV